MADLYTDQRMHSKKDEPQALFLQICIAEALKTTFSKLKFKVKELCDKTAAEIKSELKDVSEMDHSAYDCIVICILSHGIKDYFRGSDWKLVAEKDIFPLFR